MKKAWLCVGWSERETTSLEHATPHRRQKKQPLKQQQKIERKQPEKPTQGPNNVFDHHWAECDCVGFYPLVELLQRQKQPPQEKRKVAAKTSGKDKAGQKIPGHAEKEPSVSPDEAPKETEDSEQIESGRIFEENQQNPTASAKEGTVQQQNGAENSAEEMDRAPAVAAEQLDSGAGRSNALSDYARITTLPAQTSQTGTV
ncbi:hypothetical protein niasHT_032975 [Heterodera trifolii]|uniref:Uncharacterized protein n=1 Tax=Heterodera trifolii TaxID=157864 RepID=A0ABD2HVQ7_9BILA